MKIEWAKKIAEVIQEVNDPHGSITATEAIIVGLCARLNGAFPEFEFYYLQPGEVAVKKTVSTYSRDKTEPYQG